MLIAAALEHFGASPEVTVDTFGEDLPEGRPARRLYESFGFVASEFVECAPDGGRRQRFRWAAGTEQVRRTRNSSVNPLRHSRFSLGLGRSPVSPVAGSKLLMPFGHQPQNGWRKRFRTSNIALSAVARSSREASVNGVTYLLLAGPSSNHRSRGNVPGQSTASWVAIDAIPAATRGVVAAPSTGAGWGWSTWRS
jgi:hypothetical protein